MGRASRLKQARRAEIAQHPLTLKTAGHVVNLAETTAASAAATCDVATALARRLLEHNPADREARDWLDEYEAVMRAGIARARQGALYLRQCLGTPGLMDSDATGGHESDEEGR